MQTEIDGTQSAGLIHILGVNGVDATADNDLMVEGRSLPLLQDDAASEVWESWGVEYRDVVVLNASGHRVYVYNLTDNDLNDADSFATLRDALVELAAEL